MNANSAPAGSSPPPKSLTPAAGHCGTDAIHAWKANVRLVSNSARPPAAAVATARSARTRSIVGTTPVQFVRLVQSARCPSRAPSGLVAKFLSRLFRLKIPHTLACVITPAKAMF